MMTVGCGFVAARGEAFSSHGERVVKAGHFTMKCIFRNKSDFSKLYFRNKNWMGNQNLFYIPIPVLKKMESQFSEFEMKNIILKLEIFESELG